MPRSRVTNHTPYLLAVVAGLAMVTAANAQTNRTWRTATTNDWGNSGSWVGSAIAGESNVAVFGQTASISAFTVNSNFDRTIGGLLVQNQNPTFAFGNASGPLTLTINGNSTVGGTGNILLSLSRGTFITNGIVLGRTGGQPGRLTVRGPETTLRGLAAVGRLANGVLNVLDGAHVESGQTGNGVVEIGTTNATGTVTVSGVNDTNPSRLTVDTATLVIRGALVPTTFSVLEGGEVNIVNNDTYLQSGSILVSGAGSSWTTNRDLYTSRPEGGPSSITVSDGATFTAPYVIMSEGWPSSLTISGAGSVADIDVLRIGGNAPGRSGTVQVLAGASLTCNAPEMSVSPSTAGGDESSLTIDGTGSNFTYNGWLRVGDNVGALGAMIVSNGGIANLGNSTQIGHQSGSVGRLVISGPETAVTTAGYFAVGQGGRGSLDISDGGSLTVGGRINFGGDPGSTVRIAGQGSTLNMEPVDIVEHYATVQATFEAGAYVNTGGYAMNGNLPGAGNTSRLTVRGPGTLFTPRFLAVSNNALASIEDGATVEIVGGGIGLYGNLGTQVLELSNGASIYTTGRVDVGGGSPTSPVAIFDLGTDGYLTCLDYVNVVYTGVLTGSGIVEGVVGINGTLSPGGDSSGGIDIVGPTSDLFFNPDARFLVDIGGLTPKTEFDQVNVVDNRIRQFGGHLQLRTINNFDPPLYHDFHILTYMFQQGVNFFTVSGLDLGNGKAWRVQRNSTSVTATALPVSSISPSSPAISTVVGFTPSTTLSATLLDQASQPVEVDITASAIWTSDNPAVLEVLSPGKLRAVSSGQTTLRASFSGIETVIQVTINDFVPPPTLTPGLQAQVYDLFQPNFDILTPYASATLPSVSLEGIDRFDRLGTVFTGALNVTVDGIYRFRVPSDDGSQLFINGERVLLNGGLHGCGSPEVLVPLTSGFHEFRIEAYENTGGECVHFDWQLDNVFNWRSVSGADLVGGTVNVDYYAITYLPFPNTMIDWSNYIPTYDRIITAFDDGIPPTVCPYGASWCSSTGQRAWGYLYVPEGGDVTFNLVADDIAQVFIDDQLVIQSPFRQSQLTTSATVNLTQGFHPIAVDSWTEDGYWALRLSADGGGFSNQILTSAMLFHGELPPACYADFNQDGGIDGSDIDAFFTAWEAGDSSSDVNGDGGVDGSDVNTFFIAWENGAC